MHMQSHPTPKSNVGVRSPQVYYADGSAADGDATEAAGAAIATVPPAVCADIVQVAVDKPPPSGSDDVYWHMLGGPLKPAEQIVDTSQMPSLFMSSMPRFHVSVGT